MATTDAELIGTSTGITITLNSLGNSATVGRQSTVVDNTSNLFIELLITVIISTSASALAAPFLVSVLLSESEDGTNFSQDDGVMGATDAAYTINTSTNLRLIGTMYCPTSSKVYNGVFKVYGPLPRKWALIVVNNTGQSLLGSGNSASYSGIKYTNT